MTLLPLILLLAAPLPGTPTATVVVGERYRAGALHRLVLGTDYRALWTTPVTLEVLDLQRAAGGLTPVRRVGGQQTLGLALKGADGHSYTFRSVDKDPSEILPDDLQGSIADRIVQDQMAAAHPGGAVVASPITVAAGVITTRPRLVVLPDDPALGEFRATFAGLVGTFEEYPQPGYEGATEILDHVEMWKRMQAGPADRVDARALVRARLVDGLLGDWDRHRKQWRWARVPGREGWQPIAEDRDQAFARFEGLLLAIARGTQPRFVEFGDAYPDIEGLTFNGSDVDRQLLTELDRGAWTAVARELQAAITDPVIDEAVSRLPAEWRAVDGPRLRKALVQRRDHLGDLAHRFYAHLAREVDVRLTDAAEVVTAEADGDTLHVSVAADGKPYWSRTFESRDTDEVRLYLEGGDDRVTLRGSTPIRLRVIDATGHDVTEGDVDVADADYVAPPGPPRAPWIPARDWGRRTIPAVWLTGGPDVGIFLGGGILSHGYGFRKHPWADRQVLRGGYALGAKTFRAEYLGEFRRENSGTVLSLGARASGIDILRFYGYGNDTSDAGDDQFYRVRQQQFEVSPGISFAVDRLRLSVGPRVQFTTTRDDADRLVGQLDPYGSGDFAQVGLEAGATLDTRDRTVNASRGLLLSLAVRGFPEIGDVERNFATVRADFAAFMTPGHGHRVPTLAVRAGVSDVEGRFPFHEAAFIGGPDNVRGLRPQRYAGDRAYWGGADLRLPLGRATVILPGEIGLVGIADAGRVELSGVEQDDWHTGVGGGVWFSVIDRQNTVSVVVVRAESRTSIYAGLGLGF